MTKLCRIRNCCSRFLATQSLLLFAMVAVAAARTAEVPVGGLQLEPLIETSHSKEISRVTDFVKSFSASTPACAAKYGEMLLTSYLQVLLSTGVRPADIGNYPVCRAIPNTKTCTFPSALGVVAGPIAICAPDVCTPAALVAPQFLQLLKAVSPLAAGTLNSTGYKVEYIQCQVSYEVDGPAAGVLAYLGVFGLLVVVGFCGEFLCNADTLARPPKWLAPILAFAPKHNFKRMLAMKSKDRGGNFAALNGIRFFAMVTVIMGHSLLFRQYGVSYLNPGDIYPPNGAFTKWYFQIIPSAEFAVDAFFMMSGFLVTYQVLQLTYKYMAKQQDSGLLATLRGMRVPVMLLHRWLRLAPLLMTVILLQMYIVPLLSTGPVWNWDGSIEICQKWWWTNILFVNNLVPFQGTMERMCMGWTWYLGNDFQFFCLTPIFIALFAWRPRAGWISVVTATLASLIAGTVIFSVNDLSFVLTAPTDYSDDYYARPWTRLPAYTAGIMFAFAWIQYEQRCTARAAHQQTLLGSDSSLNGGTINGARYTDKEARTGLLAHEDRHTDGAALPGSKQDQAASKPVVDLSLPWSWAWGLGLVGIGLILVCYYVAFDNFRDASGKPYNAWPKAAVVIYGAWSRLAYSIGLAFCMVPCFTKQAGVIGQVLGSPVFEPLARLTYGAYLVHPIVMLIIAKETMTLPYYTTLGLSVYTMHNLMAAYLISAALFLLVEKPLMNLEALVMPRG